MFERNIYDQYGIHCGERFNFGEYEGFQSDGELYIVLPADELFITEQKMLAIVHYFHMHGDRSILIPVPMKTGQYESMIDGQRVYLCKVAQTDRLSFILTGNEGERLASFHQDGMQLAQLNDERWQPWNQLWEKRLEQLENWYERLLYEGPQSEVDELFLFTFPYYMGLTENAIQYVVDTHIDSRGELMERVTVCHHRYSSQAWLILSEKKDYVKRPTSFLFDYPSRDIAEYIRSEQSEERVEQFLQTYYERAPFTTELIRLVYARLLFPLHYFEVIESYYRSELKEVRVRLGEQFFALLQREKENERFLKRFAHTYLQMHDRSITFVDWLK